MLLKSNSMRYSYISIITMYAEYVYGIKGVCKYPDCR